MTNFGFFQITKADSAQRLIYLTATDETKDKQREIMDYPGSKPFFQKWSNSFEENTDGKSYGNVRLQHNPMVPIGKIAEPLEFDDDAKRINVVVKVVDDNAWNLVEEGVLTGASIAGRSVKKWYDNANAARRYIVDPIELSLVDAPCNPSSKFLLIKADGSEIECDFNPHEEIDTEKVNVEDLEDPTLETDIDEENIEECNKFGIGENMDEKIDNAEKIETVEKTDVVETDEVKDAPTEQVETLEKTDTVETPEKTETAETTEVVEKTDVETTTEDKVEKTDSVETVEKIYEGSDVKTILKAVLPVEIAKVFSGTDSEKRERIYGALNEAIKVPFKLIGSNSGLYFWIRDVYADKIVIAGNLEGDGDDDYYQIGYTISDDGVVTITTEPVQVRLEYVATVDENPNHANDEPVTKNDTDVVDTKPEETLQKNDSETQEPKAEVEKTDAPAESEVAEIDENIQKVDEIVNMITEENFGDVIQKVGAKYSKTSLDQLQKVSHLIGEMGGACTCEKCSSYFKVDDAVEKADKAPEVNIAEVLLKVEALEKTITDLGTQKDVLISKVEALEKLPDDSNAPKAFALNDKTLLTDAPNTDVSKSDIPENTTLSSQQKLNDVWRNQVLANPVQII